jgi:hypothetical protein
MRSRRSQLLVTGAAACALSFSLLAAAAPGNAAPGPRLALVSVTAVEVDVQVGPDQGTHCRVVGDLYVPSTATPQQRQPAILTTNGFGGSKADQAGIANALAQRDYVVLSYSGLGFGGSQCKVSLDEPAFDGLAASQLIDYLAGTRKDVAGSTVDVVALDAAGDPKVGMFGGSYGGGVQFATASVDPRLDTIVPTITWNDLSYSLAPNNTGSPADPGVLKRVWTDLFAIGGVLAGLQYAPGDPRRLLGCPNFRDWVCPALIETNVLGFGTPATVANMRRASVSSYARNVHTPALILQGEDDTLFNLQEAVRTYQALDARGTPVRMIWHQWGHSGATPPPGDLDLSGQRAPETTYLGRRVLDWYAYWLRGDHSRDLGPKLAYFRDWVPYDGAAAAGSEPAYGVSETYPAGTTKPFYLSGNGSLTTDRTAVAGGSRSWANLSALPTSYSEFPPDWDDLPPSDLPGTYAAWTSAPLAGSLDTAGVPTLDVRFTSPLAAVTQLTGPAGRLVVFAKIYDVAPDGSINLVNRLVSPVRVPNVNQAWRIELPGIVHRWEQGHRIQVVLAASDVAYAGNTAVLPVSVNTTPSYAPALNLPVVAE